MSSYDNPVEYGIGCLEQLVLLCRQRALLSLRPTRGSSLRRAPNTTLPKTIGAPASSTLNLHVRKVYMYPPRKGRAPSGPSSIPWCSRSRLRLTAIGERVIFFSVLSANPLIMRVLATPFKGNGCRQNVGLLNRSTNGPRSHVV